jgi:hypothetical protein
MIHTFEAKCSHCGIEIYSNKGTKCYYIDEKDGKEYCPLCAAKELCMRVPISFDPNWENS